MRQEVTWEHYEALRAEAGAGEKHYLSIAEQIAIFIRSKGYEGCSEELAVTTVSRMTNVPVAEIYRHWTSDIVPVLRREYGYSFNCATCRWYTRTKRTRVIPAKAGKCSVRISS